MAEKSALPGAKFGRDRSRILGIGRYGVESLLSTDWGAGVLVEDNRTMSETVRTTIDIPAPVYRRLREQAARQGCPVGELVTRGINQVLSKPGRTGTKRVEFPLIPAKGPKKRLTNKQLYEFIEFP